MSQVYLKELIEKAQNEMPLLQYDLQNASTHMTLQAATQRLFNVMTYMLHNLIHASVESASSAPAPAPLPPKPVVVAPPAPVIVPQRTGINLPPPGGITQPAVTPPTMQDRPDVPIEPGVANVIITPQGTRVVAATGATSVLPPGEAVDLAASTGQPVLPDAPPGVDNIVLPQGGGLTPEVLAALSNRTAPTG